MGPHIWKFEMYDRMAQPHPTMMTHRKQEAILTLNHPLRFAVTNSNTTVNDLPLAKSLLINHKRSAASSGPAPSSQRHPVALSL